MSIWLKEFIKLKSELKIMLVVHLCVIIYFLLATRSMFIKSDAIMVWVTIIMKEVVFFSMFQNLLLATGFILGIRQFSPEASGKLFRISCHLPISEFRLTATMLSFGIFVLTAFWLVEFIVVFATAYHYFPSDVYMQVPYVMFYWYLTACILYGLMSLLTLEPSVFYKIAFAIALSPVMLLFMENRYNIEGAYLLLTACMATIYTFVTYYAALRFRMGE